MRRIASVVWFMMAVCAHAQRQSDFQIPQPVPAGSTLVLGLLGGFDRWNDPDRAVRKLILKLRDIPDVYAESCENHHRNRALRLLKQALDRNRDGRLDASEARAVRIVLLGQSLGGGAVVKTARELNNWGVPVALTVQVDSVGPKDHIIPSNVAAAVNYYQREMFTVRGQTEIRAEDPRRTRILENERFFYPRSVELSSGSWTRRKFGGAHAKMEADPVVWERVERHVLSAIRDTMPVAKGIQ